MVDDVTVGVEANDLVAYSLGHPGQNLVLVGEHLHPGET